jgi:hypothetical protein
VDNCLYCGHPKAAHDSDRGECGVLSCDCIAYDDGSPDDFEEVEELELGDDADTPADREDDRDRYPFAGEEDE